MDAGVDSGALEAEISGCCQAIYRASDMETAMRHWVKLRKLQEQWTEAEDRLFLLESRGVSPPRDEGHPAV